MRFRTALLAAIVAATAFAQGVVDVHSHLIPTEFVSALENEGRLMDEGFPLPKYDVDGHLKWMNEAGVETSVLTLAAPQPSSATVVRKTNAGLSIHQLQKSTNRILNVFATGFPRQRQTDTKHCILP